MKLKKTFINNTTICARKSNTRARRKRTDGTGVHLDFLMEATTNTATTKNLYPSTLTTQPTHHRTAIAVCMVYRTPGSLVSSPPMPCPSLPLCPHASELSHHGVFTPPGPIVIYSAAGWSRSNDSDGASVSTPLVTLMVLALLLRLDLDSY